jgi:peptidoglycan/LPS O-acetylase OafA/YrhL
MGGADPVKPPAAERNHALDMLRGLAAIGVAVYHFLYWTAGIQIESMGTFTVYGFFMLSAVTMMMVYGDRFRQSVEPGACRSFFVNRVARLLPLLAAVSLVSLLYALRNGEPGAFGYRAALTATGLFSLTTPGSVAASVGTWSLAIEIFFYLLFPLIALWAGRAGLTALVSVLLVFIAAQQVLILAIRPLLPNFSSFWEAYVAPLSFAPFFVLGLLIFRLEGKRSYAFAMLGAAALAVSMAFSLAVPVSIYESSAVYVGLTAVTGLAVFGAWRAKLPRRLQRIANLLGEISYALYLTHWITADVVGFAARRLHLPLWQHMCAYLATALIVAYATFKLFERPAQNAIRHAFRVRSDRPGIATLP